MAAFSPNAPARRNAVLEHFDRDNPVAGVDAADVFSVRMAVMFVTMTMVVSVIVIAMGLACCGLGGLLILPCPPEHPECHADDDGRRCKLEIWLERLGIDAPPQIHAAERNAPDDNRMREGCRQSQKDGLRHCSPDRDNEGGHHRLGMAGFQSVQRTEQDRAWDE